DDYCFYNGKTHRECPGCFVPFAVCVVSRFPYYNSLKDCLSWPRRKQLTTVPFCVIVLENEPRQIAELVLFLLLAKHSHLRPSALTRGTSPVESEQEPYCSNQ
ncbi:DENND3 isoform 10, partial [Pan troglodytes]